MATMHELRELSTLREADRWELAAVFHGARRHLRLSGAIVLGCLVLAGLSLLLPAFYTADAILSYDPQTPLIRGGGDLPMTDPSRDAQIDAQLALVASPPVAQDVARAVDLAANPALQREADALAAHSDHRLSRDEALGAVLLDHVKARRLGQTTAFAISFTARTAEQAARIANDFAASYLQAAVRQKSVLADTGVRQLVGKLAELRRQATQADSDLAGFRVANHLLVTPDAAAQDQEVAALRSQLADARGQAALARARSIAANAVTVVGGGNGGSVDTTPVSALTTQRATSAAELAALLGHHGEMYPKVIDARRKLGEFDAQLAQAMSGNRHSAAAEARGAAARATALATSLGDAQDRLATGLGDDARLLDLQNSALAARQAYQDVLKISADQTAQRALLQPDAQQIGIATPPLRAIFPRAGPNLLVGLALGLGAAVTSAFIRETWRHTLASVADIERWLETDYFAPLALFPAVPPHVLPVARQTTGPCDPIEAVVLHPHSAFANGIRSLGSAALFAANNGRTGGRVIGVTSAMAGEGKTTVSTAMGRMLAGAGATVALLTWPRDSAAAPGEAGQIDSSGFGLVQWGVPTGFSSGLRRSDFSVDQFVQMIAVLRHEYEVVIINTPPILAGGANRQLLECMDALVLLVRWRSTPVRTIREAMHRIAAAGGHVSGVALSMVRAESR